MKMVDELAAFVARATYQDLSEQTKAQLKIRILDSLGCAIGALDADTVAMARAQVEELGPEGPCALIGGGVTSPDRAAFYNCALVRYLDFNDSYLAKGETCHPSDNIGALLAAADYSGASGRDFLTALAVAYQVQCRLSDVAPVRAKGFDHTTQGSFAVAAGASRAMGLDTEKTANAIAICGTAFNALRVTRTGALSHWKGLAYPNAAFCCVHGVFLAKRGITGPREVFEGNKGFMESISGPFEMDWSNEDLERVNHTIIKKFNAEIHSQSAVEGVLELKKQHGFSASQVSGVAIKIFDVAYHIIGGGEEGEKTTIRSKEEADHSLPYLIAVALLDDQIMPEQYQPDRILRNDVQDLLKRVKIAPDDSFSKRFPAELPCQVEVALRDGRVMKKTKRDYEGFHTSPLQWETVQGKFKRLSRTHADPSTQDEIVKAVYELDGIRVQDLAGVLRRVHRT